MFFQVAEDLTEQDAIILAKQWLVDASKYKSRLKHRQYHPDLADCLSVGELEKLMPPLGYESDPEKQQTTKEALDVESVSAVSYARRRRPVAKANYKLSKAAKASSSSSSSSSDSSCKKSQSAIRSDSSSSSSDSDSSP